MSELPRVMPEYELNTLPGKFAGLESSYALKRASELLDHEVVARYLEPYLAQGKLADAIGHTTGESEEEVLDILERLEVTLATVHLQHSFGHSANILARIQKAEAAIY